MSDLVTVTRDGDIGVVTINNPPVNALSPPVLDGLIAGAGGRQRRPRLAGVAKAAEMCAGGEPVKASDALAAGILDKLIDGDLLKGAIAFAREVAAKGPPRKTRDLKDKLGSLAANG